MLNLSLRFIALLAIALAVTVFYQWQAHAFTAELASFYPDEGSHYINTLLVGRYLQQDPGGNPLTFAQALYLHYPMVSIGHWPPAFYILGAGWMLATSQSVASMIALSGVVTAGFAATTGLVAARRYGLLAGIAVTLLTATFPLIRMMSTSLMVDIAVGLLALLAALAYAKYLATGRSLWSIAFGAIAACAILTKGNGLALALVPPLAILFAGRLSLLRRLSFWWAALAVLVIAGPWTVLTYRATVSPFMYTMGLEYTALATRSNLAAFLGSVGLVGLLLAAIGLVNGLRDRAADPDDRAMRCAMGALLIGVFLFQIVVPAGNEERYMIPAFPAVILLALAGIRDLAVRAPRSYRTVSVIALAALLAVVDLTALGSIPIKPDTQVNAAVRQILAENPAPNTLVLAALSGAGEGAVVAAAADMDPAERLIIGSGQKLCSTGNFFGTDYVPRYPTAEAAGEAMERLGVAYVVIDTAPSSIRREHVRQLRDAADARHWQLLSQSEASKGELLLYRIDANAHRPADLQALTAALGKPTAF